MILDDQFKLQSNGTDKNFYNNMNHRLDGRNGYSKPKGFQKRMEFIIGHYAGKVTYDCETFVEKNKDSVSNQIKSVMAESKQEIIRNIYQPLLETGT